MVPISYQRTIKILLVVSAVSLSALFTLVAVFDVSTAQANNHEHAQRAPVTNSPRQVVQYSPARPASTSAITDVSIVDFAFEPSTITITAGSSVRWTRSPASIFTHTTTSDAGSMDPWNSGDLAPGASFTKQFNTPGTFTYHCEHHPFTMNGTVVVLPAGPVPPAAVSIAGPFVGVIDTAYTFTATVSPLTATVPITYFWQATGQSPIMHTGSELSDTVVFTWT